MAFGRGHAAFTIDTLKLPKDSLPAAVTEPPPVFPELHNTPHPLIDNSTTDYDYKLKLKLNFHSNFRAVHDSTKDDQEKTFILNKWEQEWLLVPRELKQACRLSKVRPNLSKTKVLTTKKKKATLNIDLNTFEEKTTAAGGDDDDEGDNEKNDENLDINENDIDDEGKSKDTEKKKLTDNENDVDGEISEDEEDMDEDEAADYIDSYFDPGDRDDDDLGDDDGDGGD